MENLREHLRKLQNKKEEEKENENNVNKYGEIAVLSKYSNILNVLQKDLIAKWQCKENEINNRLDCIKGENDLSIKKHDNSETYNLVEKQKEIQYFIEDLMKFKKYIEYQEKISDKEELLQIDAKTGELKEVASVVDDINLICRTYLNSCDNINANNDFGNGMRTAYKIILDCINL